MERKRETIETYEVIVSYSKNFFEQTYLYSGIDPGERQVFTEG